MTDSIRIVLADDHPIVLNGLKSLIQADAGLELVGEATTGPAALELIRAQQPDVAILDISMPGLNGIAVTKRVAEECPSVRVVMLTVHEDRAYLNQALQAGVCGYVLKRSLSENLTQAIHAVVRHGTYIDPSIAAKALGLDSTAAPPSKRSSVPLTLRETEVLRLTALGQTSNEIARDLGVSIKSVETFKARGTKKLGLRTRADIVRYAVAQGWFAELS
jgi:DNA-binding NarL/FixJ family response regulator